MKNRANRRNMFLFFPILLIFLFTGCEDKITETRKMNVPLYMSLNDLRSAVEMTEPEEISIPGKIYFKDNHLFINEVEKGIHVIDNSDPSNPVTQAFINIPGNVDMAIRGNVLYADSYVDLVALDISDLDNVTELKRIREIFPKTIPYTESEFPTEEINWDNGVITGWVGLKKM
jgi:hypothetical protein